MSAVHRVFDGDAVMDRGPAGPEGGAPQPTLVGYRLLATLYFLNTVLSLALGVRFLVEDGCSSCAGLVSGILPWAGAIFYGALSRVARSSPRSSWLSHALGLYVFCHALLMTESVLLRRICIGCILTALVGAGAALVHVWLHRQDRPTLFSAVILGALAGFFYPVDRVDDVLTRRFWPSRILNQAPAFVDRVQLAGCEHPSRVRLLLYEDSRTCRSCSSLRWRVLPELTSEFADNLCIHYRAIPATAQGQTLPLIVLVSREVRMVTIEGVIDYDRLRELIRSLSTESAGPRGSR
jgi:hypothetical protein